MLGQECLGQAAETFLYKGECVEVLCVELFCIKSLCVESLCLESLCVNFLCVELLGIICSILATRTCIL